MNDLEIIGKVAFLFARVDGLLNGIIRKYVNDEIALKELCRLSMAGKIDFAKRLTRDRDAERHAIIIEINKYRLLRNMLVHDQNALFVDDEYGIDITYNNGGISINGMGQLINRINELEECVNKLMACLLDD